jgi:alpha-galactosidase
LTLFQDAGYQYVNIDDCWSVKSNREYGSNKLLPNLTRFPDGISGLAKKVHDLGLKIGIYSSAGTHTCAGYPASLGFEDLDARTFADWGIDCKGVHLPKHHLIT